MSPRTWRAPTTSSIKVVRYATVLFSIVIAYVIQPLLHEVGHVLYLWANGIPCDVRYGEVYGRMTLYIDADIPPELTTGALLSGGIFAGIIFLILAILYRPLLWAALNQFNMGLWEPVAVYTGFSPYVSAVIAGVEIVLIIATMLYYTVAEFGIFRIETRVVWLYE